MSDERPYWPELGVEVEAALGRFVIAWAMLEHEVDGILTDLLMIDSAPGMKVTASLMTLAKLKLSRSLFSELRGLDPVMRVGAAREAEFDRLVRETERMNERRNEIIHGRPAYMEDPPLAIWIKWGSGKAGLKGRFFPLGAKTFSQETAETRKLAEAWSALRSELTHALTAIQLAEADELLLRGKVQRRLVAGLIQE